MNGKSVVIFVMQVKAPIVVVGCKLDLRDENEQVSLESLMTQLLQQFRDVVTCIECSAATLYQVYCFAALFLLVDAPCLPLG